jgi:isopenicillin N synthase-like dioxygenase
MLGVATADSHPSPDVLKRSRPVFQSMMRKSHFIATLILEIINNSLNLPECTLTNLHRIDAPSGDLVRLIKASPQPAGDRRTALPAHTDYGSITIVFNRLGGLQVFSPPGPHAEWLYVKPLAGHAVVNIGDAMVKFTNGLLRSNLHRIVSPPGEQANFTRYSLLYFCRPDDDVVLRRLEGSSRIPDLKKGEVEESEATAKDWILLRGMTDRADRKYGVSQLGLNTN